MILCAVTIYLFLLIQNLQLLLVQYMNQKLVASYHGVLLPMLLYFSMMGPLHLVLRLQVNDI